MKTALITITTFAIALTVFAFNTNPVMAKEQDADGQAVYRCDWAKKNGRVVGKNCVRISQSEIEELEDLDQLDDRVIFVSDSGEEGSTSAAGAQ
ncbi:MAG: hypothetical protein OXF09_04785 [Hyphomicrobiales bacterium]|nr:hypothetical protein [Hyphomicrobiales bacterium]